MSDTVVGGRYRLGTRLGSGGMGRVWLALDQVLHRSVAVKEVLLPEGLAEAELHELRQRTLREARTAARLNHPSVVRVYDAIYDDGRPWIVMEYVPSRSLGQILTEHGPLTPERTARVGLALAGALAAAHRAGVLHRDVKPGNVLLADDGRVMLTDFGLATFDEAGTPLTQSGVVLGSPQFIAPERAQDGTSSAEADMWSLGATLYAAVEGRSPYSRPSSYATLTALATVDPDPPKRAADLAPVLLGLLKREPGSRMSIEEVHDRLSHLAAADAGRGWFVPRPRTGDAYSGDLADVHPSGDPGPHTPGSGHPVGGVYAANPDGQPAGGATWGRIEWPTPDPFEPVTTAFIAPSTPAPPAWPPTSSTALSHPAPPYPSPADHSTSAPPAANQPPAYTPPAPFAYNPLANVSGTNGSSADGSGAHPVAPDSAVSGPPSSAPPLDPAAPVSPAMVPIAGELPRRPRPDQPPGWPLDLLDRATPPEPFATFDAAGRRDGPPEVAVPTEAPLWSDGVAPSRFPVPSQAAAASPPLVSVSSTGTFHRSDAPSGETRLQRGRRRKQPSRRFGIGGPAIFLVLLLVVAGVVYFIQRIDRKSPAQPAAHVSTTPSQPPQNGPPVGGGPPPGPPPAHLSWMCTPTAPLVTKDIPTGPPAANTAGLSGPWVTYTGTTGYRMIVPPNWRMAPDDNTVCFYALDNSHVIGINQWTVTTKDPVTALRERETAMRNDGGLPRYHPLGFAEVQCAPLKCAEWDYEYDGPIGPLHVRVRDYLDGNGQAFELSWSTYANDWEQDEPTYEAMVDAFQLPKK